MTTKIQSISSSSIQLAPRRIRKTPRPPETFKQVLATGADVLLAGASAASGLVGGPLLSAAIGAARSGLARTSAPGGYGSSGAGQTQAGGGDALAAATGGTSGQSDVEAMRQMQQEGYRQSLEYLRLQQEVQQSNRRYSVASNLLKAKHDTARSAISNLRV